MGSPPQVFLFSVQHEIKTGFIFLQSCDGCSSHAKIISIAQQIILETSKVLETMQPGPSMPPQPEDYVGVYTNKYGVSYLAWFPLLLLPPIFGFYAVYTKGGKPGKSQVDTSRPPPLYWHTGNNKIIMGEQRTIDPLPAWAWSVYYT